MSYSRENEPRRITQEGRVPAPVRPVRPGSSAGGSSVQVDPKMVLMALRDNWKWALPVGLMLAAATVVAILSQWKPVYEAYSLVQIHTEQPYLAYQTDKSGSRDLDRFIETQKEILRSRRLLEKVIISEELDERILSTGSDSAAEEGDNPIKGLVKFDKSIGELSDFAGKEDKVEFLRRELNAVWAKSEFLRVAFESESAENAQRIVNTVVQEFVSEYLDEQDDRKNETVRLLQAEIDDREDKLETRREALREAIEEAAGASGMQLDGTRNTPLVSPLSGLLSQRTEAEVEIEVLKARIQTMEMVTEADMVVPGSAVRNRVETDPQVQEVQRQIALLYVRLDEARQRAKGAQHGPLFDKINGEIDEAKKYLAGYRDEVDDAIQDELRKELWQQHCDEVAKVQGELQLQLKKKEVLDARYEEERGKIKTDNGGELKIQFLQAELTQQEQVIQRISERKVELQTERKAPQRIRIYEVARVPSQPVAAYPIKELGVGVVGCMGFPFGIAVLLELLRRRIRNVATLQEISSLPVVGEIAQLPRRRIGGTVGASGRSTYLFEESFNSLRTKLILSDEWKDARVFAVTSAVNNEGKTSVCSQLAMSTARSGKGRVLLVDCDTRLPDLHKMFDTSLEPGLTDVLRGESDPEDCVNRTSLENFDVLCAGELKESPHSLFTEENLDRLLKWATSRYEFVFLDTPPILAAAESLVVAKIADASLVCAMLNISRSDQIHEACSRLTMVGCPSVGAVLNGVPFRSYTSRYGEYAYYETAGGA